jgi:hypothetical protein
MRSGRIRRTAPEPSSRGDLFTEMQPYRKPKTGNLPEQLPRPVNGVLLGWPDVSILRLDDELEAFLNTFDLHLIG